MNSDYIWSVYFECIVFVVSKYYIVKVFVFEYNLSVKPKSHSHTDIRLYDIVCLF